MRHLARWPNVLFGVWLVLAPWILGYENDLARFVDFVTGVLVVAVAILAMFFRPARFANTALGAWLVAAPFLLTYDWPSPAIINDLVVGVLVVLTSLVGVAEREGRDQGAPTLRRPASAAS